MSDISISVSQGGQPIVATVQQAYNGKLNQDKTITENGIYTADAGYSGLGTVNVNVVDKQLTMLLDGTIEEFKVPDEIISLRGYVFTDCKRLAKLDLNQVKSFADNCFYRTGYDENYPGFWEIPAIPNASYGANNVFYYCPRLKKITFAGTTNFSKTTNNSNSIIYECDNLEEVVWEEGIETIYSGMLQYCDKITSLVFPRSLKSLLCDNYTFYAVFKNLYGLEYVDFGENIEILSTYSFYQCKNLKTITINRAPDSVSGAPWGAENATVVWTGTK